MNPEAEGIALAIDAIAFSGPASKARQNCRLCHLRVPNRCDQSPASPDALEMWEGSGGCFCGASAFREVRLCANSVLADARQTARFSRSEAFWTWRRVDRKSSGQQYIQLITSNRSTTLELRTVDAHGFFLYFQTPHPGAALDALYTSTDRSFGMLGIWMS